MKRPQLISILICIYCILNSLNLAETWMSAAREIAGPMALGLWSSPVIFFWYIQQKTPRPTKERPLLLGLALFFSFTGMLGSLRILGHIGLACALGALLPNLPVHLFWLAASISWMPALDWFGGRFFPEYVTVVRILLATIPSWYFVRSVQRVSRNQS